MDIESVQNPRVKQVKLLWDRRERNQTKRFLIEGSREIRRALEMGWEVDQLFYCPQIFKETVPEGANETLSCTENVLRKISYREHPEGIIAVAKQKDHSLSKLSGSLYVVAEAVEKPGNLGAILRSCDAVRADGCILCDKGTDLYNPNVIRASTGMLFNVPIAITSSKEALKWLHEKGITLLAATPSAAALFTEVDMTIPIAIVVGTEHEGLSTQWLEKAHQQVKIPMLGSADSLNVSVATTLLLYEALRQRQRHA